VKIRNKSKKDTKNINKWVNVLKNKISEYQKDIIFKLKDLFESKLWSEIFKMMKVVKCDKSIDRKTRRIIKKANNIFRSSFGIIIAVSKQTYIQLVPVFLDIVCSLKSFKEAYLKMVGAIEESNPKVAFELWGRFYAKLLMTLDEKGKSKNDMKVLIR